jgi:hypothetical protein
MQRDSSGVGAPDFTGSCKNIRYRVTVTSSWRLLLDSRLTGG